MDLTVDQALQQGVAAHKEGRLQDAERFYRAILQAQPNHPDANHNLGLLAVVVDKPLEAIPLFKLALETNPQVEQFWLSYIDVLITVERFDEARRVLIEGEKASVSPEKLDAFHQRLRGIAPNGTTKTLQSQPLSEKRKKLARKEKSKKSKTQGPSSNAGPSQDQINGLLEHYQAGRLKEAEALATSLTQHFPKHPFGWKVLGAVLKQTGRPGESLAPMQSAVKLSLQDAEAHNNLGVTLKELGRLDESILSYVRAINLKADFDDAYCNLGLALKPARFSKRDQSLYPILINLLTGKSFVRPVSVAGAILSLLRQDNLIEEALLNTTSFKDIREVDRAINTLAHVPLLHQLMRISPLPDLQLEASFVSMRRVLLSGLRQVEASTEVIHFLSTLSLHCFTNEYVYFETEEEAKLISVLEAETAESIAQGSQPTITDTLMLATYRPLHQYEWIEKLQVLDHLPEVKVRLIEEPLAERVIAQHIPALSDVDDDVSRKVRDQYEENPYPRWVRLSIAPKVKSVAEVCNDLKLQLHSENIKSVVSPSILIAGCGTGQHSIGTASRFTSSAVTAVDLSRASLAYAQRKTSELGITNVKYLQADILNLGELGQEFDIIESAGVLHHMDDPMAGWRVLVDLLKTGGLMRIGLYSELARQHILRVREEIASSRVGASGSEIREFRGSLAESQNENHQLLATSSDFFSLSSLRDLIFHVQEHRFTLPRISCCLDELGLKFCGFESPDVVAKFKKSFGEKPDPFNLSLWHQFEEKNPRAFAEMYQFWCQKI